VPPIQSDTEKIVRNASGHLMLSRSTRTSSLFESLERGLAKGQPLISDQMPHHISAKRVEQSGLKRSNTWPRKVAATVARATHAFWSLITLTRLRSSIRSENSSPTVIVGQARGFDKKFVSVVSFARIVTESIQSSSKTITHTTTSPRHCREFMTVTTLSDRTKYIIESVEAGKNLDKITVAEFIEVSFLALMSGDEVHNEQSIMYGGNMFSMHTCVSQVSPAERVDSLRNEV